MFEHAWSVGVLAIAFACYVFVPCAALAAAERRRRRHRRYLDTHPYLRNPRETR